MSLKLFSDNDVDNYINELRINEPTNDLIKEWDNYKVNKKQYLKNK